MRKGLIFTAYFLVILLVFMAVPASFPQLSPQQLASLLVAYHQKPLLLMFVSAGSFFFDYLSWVMPQTEYREIQTLVHIRTPRFKPIVAGYWRLAWRYFLPFLALKGYVLILYANRVVWISVVVWIVEWLAWSVVSLTRRQAIPSAVIFMSFLLTRFLLHGLF
ncbi:hypothetical protein LACPH_002737 [Lacticaseibacillus parahuelsenbergensis]|uniref:Uncharacterized protein n=1 Tax=Lacticaseibacillus parahuelsenbergensis TaxID=3068305 RepID=A0ABY9L2H5_9LACO|nr:MULTISPECIES: hypothetical protein [Lacticaseibacillus]MDE3283825.1 hypothetical protein [Lacticaseibacillus casei]WLV77953.1 hypothetical protein LACPH_002737 [Lacticaseibacillus sp. NCIMB 15471]